MSDGQARPRSAFAVTARQRVRTALELAAHRSAQDGSRVVAELSALASDAHALGLDSIAELARLGSEQARGLGVDLAATTACARTARQITRALDALERESPPSEPATRPRGSGRVLVVDDSPLNMAVVCDLLDRAAFETRQAENGEIAITEVARFRPDVVLADVQMPHSTPAELCARMRAAATPHALQILLFSGMPDRALAELAKQAGADGFLSKERGPDVIVEEVTRAYRKVVG